MELEWNTSIEQIEPAGWNALAHDIASPFFEWEWLHLMETCGNLKLRTLWIPCHLTLRDEGVLVAAAPLYIKWHGTGEFQYDTIWETIALKLNVDYYPKLVGMCPVTTVPGYRFLIDKNYDQRAMTKRLLEGIEEFCHKNGVCGISFLFADPDWVAEMEEMGFAVLLQQSYLWENNYQQPDNLIKPDSSIIEGSSGNPPENQFSNQSYNSLEDFLGEFNSNQRKNIKKEMRLLKDVDFEVSIIPGEDAPEELFASMFGFYNITNDKYGEYALKYLEKSFFTGLSAGCRNRTLFSVAHKKGQLENPLGMSMLIHKNGRLFGRYWGTEQDVDSLYFNCCYYEPIKWAIDNNISTYDPGMGGLFKLRRGFRAVPTYVLHKYFDPDFFTVMEAQIERINNLMANQIDKLNSVRPFSSKE